MCNRFGFAKGMKTLEVVERRGGKDGGGGGGNKKTCANHSKHLPQNPTRQSDFRLTSKFNSFTTCSRLVSSAKGRKEKNSYKGLTKCSCSFIDNFVAAYRIVIISCRGCCML